MRIVPDSTITLYSGVPITKGRQLIFNNLGSQTTYFDGFKVAEQVNCQMIKRRRGWLRLNIRGTVIKGCNYISFINPSFDNKRIYAIITDYDYINNECVEIQYAIDYFQTWMFDFDLMPSLIEREHVSLEDQTNERTNPYNPDILEMRTVENLPISEDIEKPFYNIVSGNEDSGDGIMCGSAMAGYAEISSTRIGVLLTISGINFEYLDATYGGNVTPGTPLPEKPSKQFADAIKEIRDLSYDPDYSVTFYSLGYSEYTYLHTNYSTQADPIPQTVTGGAWNSNPGGSMIKPPVTYIFIDNAAREINGPAGEVLNKIINALTTADAIDNLVNIQAIPSYLMLFAQTSNIHSGYVVNMLSALNYINSLGIRNKKLALYPFSYYRAIAPNGDKKEYKIEDFEVFQNDDTPLTCEVLVNFDFYNSPSLIVSPIGYKMSGVGREHAHTDNNPTESLIFNQFGTMPYEIDAFTAQMASVANNIISNNTIERSYDIEQQGLNMYKGYIKPVADIIEGAKKIGGGELLGGISQGIDGVFGGAEARIYEDKTRNEWSQTEDAYKVLAGDTDNAVYDNFQFSKPAYAANIYHYNNSNGDINYNRFMFLDIVFMRVTINPEILKLYDQYFDNYGYTSSRIGIPRFFNYLHNVGNPHSADELPSWRDVDGKMLTYIKMKDAKVTGVMLPVAQAIQDMLNMGVQLVDPNRPIPNQG